MNTGDKIALISLIVGLVTCVGAWLVVPGFRQWAHKRKRWMAFAAALLAVLFIAWLERPEQAPGLSAGPDIQTSIGNNSPNIKSSGSGPVNVQIGTPATQQPPAKPKSEKR
jgi:hypothetical protein